MSKIFLLSLLLIFSNTLNADKKVVGFISDLSGYNIDTGTSCKRGFDLAVKQTSTEFNSAVEIVYEDSQSFPKFAVNAFQKLKSTQRLIGAFVFSSPNALALSPLMLNEKIPLMAMAGSQVLTEENPLSFSSWISSSTEGGENAKSLAAQGIKKVAIITTENDYMLDVAKHFRLVIKKSNLEIVADELVAHDLMDFKAIVARILTKKPEAVFINLHTGTSPAFLKQLRQAGFQGEVHGTFYLGKENEIKAAGIENAEGGKVISIRINNPKYQEEYRKTYGTGEDSVMEYACFTGASLLFQSIQIIIDQEKDLTKESLQAEMLSAKEVQIFEQKIALKDRWFDYQYGFKVIRDGKTVFID